MKKTLFILILLCGLVLTSSGQIVLDVSGRTFSSFETGDWTGYVVARDEPTIFTFTNNSISSVNTGGYMLQAGDENVGYGTNNNLDGEVITGNKFSWTGTDMTSITHGIFTGCNINALIKYNYVSGAPMGAIRKSASSMVNTSGGIAYNIFNKGMVEVVVKGISNVPIYNNVFYSDRTMPQTAYGRGLIDIYTNTDGGVYSVAHDVKVKNNIFYTKYQINNIRILDEESLVGFECDYNIYWCEAGDPMFDYLGTQMTFDEWQDLGYDTHSHVMNPNFTNFTDFIPASRLNFGDNLGSTWQAGLSTSAVWTLGSSPATTIQNGTWQVGARIYGGSTVSVTSITVTGSNITTNGGTSQMYATVLPSNATNKTVTWSVSSVTGSASISSSGLLTAGTNGTVQVRATANDGSNVYGTGTITISGQVVTSGTYYLAPAPTGNDSNVGTINSPWLTLAKAWTMIEPGDVVYLRGGIYHYTSAQILSGVNGTAANPINIFAYPGEKPVISKGSGSFDYLGYGCAINFSGDYFHWKGISVSGFPQPDGNLYNNWKMEYANNNHIEQMVFSYGTIGFDINYHCDNNLVENCDFHHNTDPNSGYGNADGINAHTDFGSTNIVRGCRFWKNSDDGLDLYNGNGLMIIDGNWSFANGYSTGDGHGFKLGITAERPTVHLRTLRNNLSFYNKQGGFGSNAARCIIWLYNNTAYHNNTGPDYHLGFAFGDGLSHVLQNNIAFDNQSTSGLEVNFSGTVNHNSWESNGHNSRVSSADFMSMDSTGCTGSRQQNGSLPNINFLKLAATSDLINAGTDVGIAYSGSDPDLGAYEYSESVTTYPAVSTDPAYNITSSQATIGATMTNSGGSSAIVTGIFMATYPNVTYEGSHFQYINGGQTTHYTETVTGLIPNTTYYYKGWINNGLANTYGMERSFTTAPGVIIIPTQKGLLTRGGKFIKSGTHLLKY